MVRIRPYCEETAAVTIDNVVKRLTERRAEFASQLKAQRAVDRAKRQEEAGQARGLASTVRNEDLASTLLAPPARQGEGCSSSRPIFIDDDPDEHGLEDEKPFPTVDQSIPYTNWKTYDDCPQRLLAASYHVDGMALQHKTLDSDPALLTTDRTEAFQLLWQGGRNNIYAAKTFLDSLQRQQFVEKADVARFAGLAEAPSEPATGNTGFFGGASRNPELEDEYLFCAGDEEENMQDN